MEKFQDLSTITPSKSCSALLQTISTVNADYDSNEYISQRSNQVGTTILYKYSMISLFIEGQERLCLAQISNTLLTQFSYNEIHNRRVALGIKCVQCTPVQLEFLRRAGAMPTTSRRCGMITKREAERLCRSFLGDNRPPQLPENFAFIVHHKCAWGCKGSFFPIRYNSSRAKCIKCHHCDMFFSPNKFIFHSHRQGLNSKYIQPDAANFNAWRRHMMLSEQPTQDIIYVWEDVKAMFNGGNRKRIISNLINEPRNPSKKNNVTTSISSKIMLINQQINNNADATPSENYGGKNEVNVNHFTKAVTPILKYNFNTLDSLRLSNRYVANYNIEYDAKLTHHKKNAIMDHMWCETFKNSTINRNQEEDDEQSYIKSSSTSLKHSFLKGANCLKGVLNASSEEICENKLCFQNYSSVHTKKIRNSHNASEQTSDQIGNISAFQPVIPRYQTQCGTITLTSSTTISNEGIKNGLATNTNKFLLQNINDHKFKYNQLSFTGPTIVKLPTTNKLQENKPIITKSTANHENRQHNILHEDISFLDTEFNQKISTEDDVMIDIETTED